MHALNRMLTALADQGHIPVHRCLSDGYRECHRGCLQGHHRRCLVYLPCRHHLSHLWLLRAEQKNNDAEIKNMTRSVSLIEPYEL